MKKIGLILAVFATGIINAQSLSEGTSSKTSGTSFVPTKRVVFEESTGTWCGACPIGTVYMDSMHRMNPNTTVLITVHGGGSGDPMIDATYSAGMNTLNSGQYPKALCNRSIQIGAPQTMYTMYNNHKNDPGLGDLVLNTSYNANTRVATVVVNTTMASSITNNNSTTNDYRVAVAFTEDDVTGTTSGYDQHNYWTGNAYGTLKGAGHNWHLEPNPVLAANMEYDFVARTIVGGFKGMVNSLPNTIAANTTYSYTFTYTIPPAYKYNKIKAHALLIDAKTNVIHNGNSSGYLAITTDVTEKSSETFDFVLYPNPTDAHTTIGLNVTSSETVAVNVYNSLGSLVYSDDKVNLLVGYNQINLNTESFASGMYHVTISTKQGVTTKKLSINK